ncbi:MAG: glycosyltransferase family 2 protein [Candidatus Fermentibacteria bacterium]|nr:glycosyltransferase family 2 protein [Candidatus Fermentibacteria bacterium]
MEKTRIICYMPAYNSELLMEKVIRDIPLETMEILNTVLIVDDGSSDGTAELALKLAKEFPKISLVRHPENRGYGAVQKTAFDWTLENNGDIAVMLHSDGQYPPEYLKPMLAPFEKKADVVGGSRILFGDMRSGGMSKIRYYGTIWLNALENLVFRQKLTSYHSGYKAYSRNALEKIPYRSYSDTFNFDSEMLVGSIRAELDIAEIPIPTIHGEGFSSLKPVPYGLSVLGTIVRYIFGRI